MAFAVGLSMGLDGVLLGEEGVLESLLAELVGCQMVAFTVGDCGGSMCVGGPVMKFSRTIVGALGHLR